MPVSILDRLCTYMYTCRQRAGSLDEYLSRYSTDNNLRVEADRVTGLVLEEGVAEEVVGGGPGLEQAVEPVESGGADSDARQAEGPEKALEAAERPRQTEVRSGSGALDHILLRPNPSSPHDTHLCACVHAS